MDASLSFGVLCRCCWVWCEPYFYRCWLMVKVYSSRIFWVGDRTFFLTGLFTTMFLFSTYHQRTIDRCLGCF
jgi:hypothetical protein